MVVLAAALAIVHRNNIDGQDQDQDQGEQKKTNELHHWRRCVKMKKVNALEAWCESA